MNRPRVLRFILSYVIVGAVAAALVIVFAPELLERERPVVAVQEAPTRTAAAADKGPVSYAAAVEAAAPAVVNIYSSKRVVQHLNPFYNDPFFRRFFGDAPPGPSRERVETSLGSGVIVSDAGYVLTNDHVIRGADEVEVMLADGRRAKAEVIGNDSGSDLAVLRVDLDKLPVIVMGNSSDVRVGDVVMAIGNPFGVGQTVTQGIVSATERSQLGLTAFENFIQTDAAINPGNSGGALINAYGELIGINTAIFSQTGGSHGIGFAIPAHLAQAVLEDILEHGRVVRGWIGIEVQQLTPQLAESFGLGDIRGVIVAGILRGGPAHRAGLQPGDIILSIDGEAVEAPADLLRAISSRKPGSTLNISGWRNGKEIDTEVVVIERPAESG